MSFCHRVKLFENQSNYSLINAGFIRLVTWPRVERLSRKGYEGSKLSKVFKILTQRSSAKCGERNSQGFLLQHFLPFIVFLVQHFCFHHFVIIFLIVNSRHLLRNFSLIFTSFLMCTLT